MKSDLKVVKISLKIKSKKHYIDKIYSIVNIIALYNKALKN